MSENKHTKGPWRTEAYGDEFEVIGFPTWLCERHRIRGEWTVASVDDLCGDHPEEAEANARLIAAAPELLDACKRLLEELRLIRMKDSDAVYDTTCRVAADAAIAKAEDAK